MTDQLDYSTWAYDDHLAQAEKLAADADTAASTGRAPSVAAQHRESILQTTARAEVHIGLAELKKPQPAEPAPRQTRQRADKNPDS